MPTKPHRERPTPASPCQACRYLYTTWRPSHPRGCRAYGFESKSWPCDVVRSSSGTECQLFEPRPDPHADRNRGRGRHEGGLYG